ncbi:hypothetical protein E2562_010756 [Oryza meyeriana var. granulata]|uniref:Uncharacterized protein n=1 Tax=Oryza meyeriana var. granulata TaxID=110450 RepID=A0A6G1EWE9_9ORYZ|nr:hypothetical protein E2562_010756 [Oryza meyeriana var. granulata]
MVTAPWSGLPSLALVETGKKREARDASSSQMYHDNLRFLLFCLRTPPPRRKPSRLASHRRQEAEGARI